MDNTDVIQFPGDDKDRRRREVERPLTPEEMDRIESGAMTEEDYAMLADAFEVILEDMFGPESDWTPPRAG